MSKPKNMTPEQEANAKEKQKARSRMHYYANKEKYLAQCKEWRRKNPDKKKKSDTAWRARNIEKVDKSLAKYYDRNRDAVIMKSTISNRSNPERRKGISRASANRATKSVTDSYIAGILSLPTSTLRQHPDLLESKREQIKIHRQLKKQNAPESK